MKGGIYDAKKERQEEDCYERSQGTMHAYIR